MLSHKGTQTIETDQLILRKFSQDDAQAMYRNWASDPLVTRFMTWPPHTGADVSAQVIERWISGYAQVDAYDWAIELKELGEPIGSISAVHMDENTEACEIGYCLSAKYWSMGIMTEALHAVMGFMFEQVGFNRVCAKHDPLNPASGRVMQKAGMQYEGTLRQTGRRPNLAGFYDLAVYACLKAEWLKKDR